jgi:hypothetical protein
MNSSIFSPHFHSDGGTDLLSVAVDYAASLKEDCSVLKCPQTGRFHIIRKYDVERRVTQLKWVRYATLAVYVHREYHAPDTQL